MIRSLACLLALPLLCFGQNPSARDTLERFGKLRPSDDDLTMYRLDWAPSLEAARRRAAEEDRPVLLVVIHAKYGDLETGHC